ncbi:MAG: hypothetical protein KHX03_09835 [Clostridium sp.]|nr:hypothetical protein [Clostridium sp.]
MSEKEIEECSYLDTTDRFLECIGMCKYTHKYCTQEVKAKCSKYHLQLKTAECEELHTKYTEVLNLAKQNADANEYCLRYLEEENTNYKQALEPFEDEYFKGLDTKQIAELAKKSIRLTTENRKLEAALERIEDVCNVADRYEIEELAGTILDIISKAKGE